MSETIEDLHEKIQLEVPIIEKLLAQMHRVIIGQELMVNSLLIGLLGKGHVLLEGPPGLAKTLMVKVLASAVQGSFSRIQFTPDLLPADVTGTLIYHLKSNDFIIKKGPIFANFVLADEINRAPAKVQSALLEAMQEKQVTIGDETFYLEEPFLVLATQNPLDHEGTYPLPEAQTDRFMIKCLVDYPDVASEMQIVKNVVEEHPFASTDVALSIKDLFRIRRMVRRIYIDEKIQHYLLKIVFAIRYPERYGLSELGSLIEFGPSPRGSIYLTLAAKCHAFLKGRAYVVPEDVLAVVKNVLRHRIGLSYEAQAEKVSSDDLIDQILKKVQIP